MPASSSASERRLLVTGPDARMRWESDALERMLNWQGELSLPDNLDPAERMRQSREQMDVMAATDREVHANRSVNSLDVGMKRVEMVEQLDGDRFLAMVRVTADRRLQPPVHGQYLLSMDRNAVREFVYLQPLADALNVKFTVLEVSPRGAIYLLAIHRDLGTGSVIRLNADGSVAGYVPSAAPRSVVLQSLIADHAGVWLFGHDATEGDPRIKLWSERLPFRESG